MLYTTLKFLHIVLAITAIGFNSAYGLIIGRARKAGTAELKFALRTVKFMDDYVANPCYGLLLLTGVGMVHTSGYPWSLMWIHVSMALLVVAFVLALGFYTPTLRKQIAILGVPWGRRRRVRAPVQARGDAGRHPRPHRARDRRAHGLQAGVRTGFTGSRVHGFTGSRVHGFTGSRVHRFTGSQVHRFGGSENASS